VTRRDRQKRGGGIEKWQDSRMSGCAEGENSNW